MLPVALLAWHWTFAAFPAKTPILGLDLPSDAGAALQIWASKRGIGLTYIQPGKPQQNAYGDDYRS